MSKKITLLFVFALLVISGCSGKEVPRDELVVAISNSPQTLDPRLATDSYAMKIKHLIFNGLLKRDKNMELTNDLADRHEMLSPLHFRFYLKKGVRFHDGHELTSEDVIYTYQSILDDKLVSPFRGEVSKIKNISAIDKYTVEFKLKEKYAPIYTVFTYQIVPRLSGKELNDHPVGTGPYKFVSYKTDEKLKLESFSEYFGDKA
ncbi:ABC transporter substrate-binding protein, partial [bacterium]|nr:ABC transporter substrate-binding protein [bacterium]